MTELENTSKEQNISDSQNVSEKETSSAEIHKENSSQESIGKQSQNKKLSDFELLDHLGDGSYSTVMLAKEKSTNEKFAIKILDKKHIIKEKKVKYVQIEKDVLFQLQHPFIIKLYSTFQDVQSLYFVLALAENGELLQWIRKFGSLSLECIRFYSAELIDVLKYLQQNKILHRDLKPENILISSKMHILLTDFGTSKPLKAEEDRAFSFVGTAEYVSPELLTDKYVTYASDLWSLACIQYQMMTNKPPFKSANEYQTFQKITKLDYQMPEYADSALKSLIQSILVLKPQDRFACRSDGSVDYDLIQKHDFFSSINWHQLWEQQPPEMKPYEGKLELTLPQEPLTALMSPILSPTSPTSPLDNQWSTYLFPQEQVLHSSILLKRKYPLSLPLPGFKWLKRRFLLTNFGRLLWIDEEKDKQVGELYMRRQQEVKQDKHLLEYEDVSDSKVTILLKNEKDFEIKTPKKIYYLRDIDVGAEKWVQLLQMMLRQ